VVLERSAQSLLPTAAISVSAIFDASVSSAVTQHVQIATDDIAEVHVTCRTSDNLIYTAYYSRKSASLVVCFLKGGAAGVRGFLFLPLKILRYEMAGGGF